MMFVRPSVSLSETDVHCDHTMQVDWKGESEEVHLVQCVGGATRSRRVGGAWGGA